MIKNKMTLKMASEEIAILQRNGQDMLCPYIPPLQIRQKVQNPFGQVGEQISIQKSSCNSNCPLFEIKDKIVNLYCGGNSIKHEISKVIEVLDNQDDDKIISIGKGGDA